MNRTTLGLTAAAAATSLTLAACGSSNSTDSTASTATPPATTTTTASTTTAATAAAAPAGGQDLTVTSNEYAFAPTALTAKAGKVRITLKNTGKIEHELVVLKSDKPADGLKVLKSSRVSEDTSVGEVSETAAGKTKTSTLDLKPGRYIFVCNIPGHYMLGMRGTLTVQ